MLGGQPSGEDGALGHRRPEQRREIQVDQVAPEAKVVCHEAKVVLCSAILLCPCIFSFVDVTECRFDRRRHSLDLQAAKRAPAQVLLPAMRDHRDDDEGDQIRRHSISRDCYRRRRRKRWMENIEQKLAHPRGDVAQSLAQIRRRRRRNWRRRLEDGEQAHHQQNNL